jgi:acetate---CoA ligase (ADP-forming)
MSQGNRSGRVAGVEKLMRPRSVAIVGMSSKPGTAGHFILGNLSLNNFGGDIHLVGRSGGTIEGRTVLPSVDDLPEGVDLAIFTLPAAGVHEAMAACARRQVGAAVIFASGFAEVGKRDSQDELAAIADKGGVALLGPNCLGYANSVDGLRVNFVGAAPQEKIQIGRDPAVAIISQSGGLMSHIRLGLEARQVQVSYSVSTGNEAGLNLADFIDFFTTDKATDAIIIYVEQVRQPADFLAAAERARAAGKPILMMHPGRGERAKTAVNSHTGALAGDYAVMRTLVSHAGIALLENLDELIDAAEILARFPRPPSKGPGILTFSGAFCAIAHDFCDDLGLDVPPLSPTTEALLKSQLPAFAQPSNPLDLTTQPVFEPDLMRTGPQALLNDPNLGSLTISIPTGTPRHAMLYLNGVIEALKGSTKPVVFSILGDQSPLLPEFVALARERRIILSRSADRSLRAMAQVTFYGRAIERASSVVPAKPFGNLPKLGNGTLPEWRGKQLLAAAGIAIPQGALAGTVDEAVKSAASIGYPVAMKAQAPALAHKTEAGAVILNVADEAGVRRAWQTLVDNVQRAQPGLVLDGVLVERMAAKGLELMVGAKRDPQWGPVVLVGLGGIWVEAIGDVRLLPPDLDEKSIVAEIGKLRSAKLLGSFRGSPARDVAAVARTVSLIGQLMRTVPEISEIDINPLFVHAEGEGVTAADALIVNN